MGTPDSKLFAPSADRNKNPILEVLQKYIPDNRNEERQLSCLEIASGTGQHVVHFARGFPYIAFQPSEFTTSSLPSIQQYIIESGLQNIKPPIEIDVTTPISTWNLAHQQYDLILNINMIHITPWQCTLSLFEKAGKLLTRNGLLITYGPYSLHGEITPESNVNFDQSLKNQDERWGLRDIDDLEKLASVNGLKLVNVEDMPSNNKTLIWKRY